MARGGRRGQHRHATENVGVGGRKSNSRENYK